MKLSHLQAMINDQVRQDMEQLMFSALGVSSSQMAAPAAPMTATEVLAKMGAFEAEARKKSSELGLKLGAAFGSAMPIVETEAMADVVEDWSRVRSPSRARRRRHKHRQNIVVTHVPRRGILVADGKIFCHPAVARQIRENVTVQP